MLSLGSLGSSALLSAGLQACAYAHSTFNRASPTEHYYDLSGSLTHLALVAHALAGARRGGGVSPRAAALALLSTVWASRLGVYLYARVSRLGADERFTELKKSRVSWAVPWAAQALWCFLLQAPLTIAARAARGGALSRWDAAGVALALGGLALEAAADAHKDAAKRAAPAAPVTDGPFRFAVYPAYFGECTLWVGAAVLAAPACAGAGQLALAAAAPAFTALLLHRVSGIPLLEKSAWAKYGGDARYRDYRARTNVFWPWFPRAAAAPADVARVRALAEAAAAAAAAKRKAA